MTPSSTWSKLIFGFSCASTVLAASYRVQDTYIGHSFLDGFTFQNIADPTHGRVNYVDAGTAARENLTFASSTNFIARSDFTTVLNPSGPGRNSVRLMSKKQYRIGTVLIANLHHMPEGCGTWPAFWTVGDNWPNNGEIDILEGVNNVGNNQGTLHTSPGCTMPGSRSQTGTALQNDCNVWINSNTGCGVSFGSRSFGPSFNANGGGWYAMELTANFVKIWFWARGTSVPSDVSGGSATINTNNWGTPVAYFPNTSCNINSHFGPQNIIINLTFCGDWAGSVYGSNNCPSTCNDFVNNNPGAFQNAYFDFLSLRAYAVENPIWDMAEGSQNPMSPHAI
ncbi:glycoside hydrolase family 16 protein [Collybiopsis luxurians FD-317 M1]|uniref:Glycoside hydrolase family 16 protein n=1 Tax=Collybiopsis luxurians FD-317 M1 TaxID=944289 RepID=A0A0D0C8S6_9AGAR|nr:glycoside hydrolase family 16 protein [Collybiopsis luxurians FD-317 M1]